MQKNSLSSGYVFARFSGRKTQLRAHFEPMFWIKCASWIWITLLHISNEANILSIPVPFSKSSSQCVLNFSSSALLCKNLGTYRSPSSSKLTTYIHAAPCAMGWHIPHMIVLKEYIVCWGIIYISWHVEDKVGT